MIAQKDTIQHKAKTEAAGKTQEDCLACNKCAILFHFQPINIYKVHVMVPKKKLVYMIKLGQKKTQKQMRN